MTNEEALRLLNDMEFKDEYQGKDDYTSMLLLCKEAIEKQIPKNRFINECDCIVDYGVLYEAIKKKCKSLNCFMKDEYRIVLRSGYASVCIDRNRYYVHILISELLFKQRKNYVVHHKDRNKLNNLVENLDYISSSKHAKIHHTGVDYRCEEGKWKGITSASNSRKRNDVSTDEVLRLRNQGMTIPQIAKILNCGINTINRRLGMK